MFVQIEDNYLKINRGDSYELPLIINANTKLDFEQYQLRQFDKIYIGIIEPNQSFENAIIRKVLTISSPTTEEGYPIFSLEPEDTEYLLTGKYYIEIKLVQKENGKDKVTTILPLKELYIDGTNKTISNKEVYFNTKSVTESQYTSEWEPLQENNTTQKNEETDYYWQQL